LSRYLETAIWKMTGNFIEAVNVGVAAAARGYFVA
jgi:hypothetical protein